MPRNTSKNAGRLRTDRGKSAGPSRLDRTGAAIALAIAAVTLAVYAQTVTFGYINYDDPAYVFGNDQVKKGVTAEGFVWAFKTNLSGNRHPLTWLSHMTDWQLFGDWAGGHHLTNMVLHAASAALLFLVLWRLTGWRWPSALAAGFFALHPLHVESVAWISERKDVLSTLLMLLALLAYMRYVRRCTVGRYLLVAALMALGLAAKPMLVTLPFVFLLLDYWPLGRLRLPRLGTANMDLVVGPGATGRTAARREPLSLAAAFVEKLPLLVLSAVSSVATLHAQKASGAMLGTSAVALPVRATNAAISAAAYLYHTVWPLKLAVFYPYRDEPAWWLTVTAAALLIGITTLVLLGLRKRPWLAVGWFWYLGTLVPVIGLVQVGSQAMADRYTYIPLMGIFLMIAGLVAEAAPRGSVVRLALRSTAIVLLAACAALTTVQLRYWRNNRSLFEHALAVTGPNAVARVCFGHVLTDEGRLDEAVAEYRQALTILPDYYLAHASLGEALGKLERFDEAIEEYRLAIRSRPRAQDLRYMLGVLLAHQGKHEEAIASFRKALALDPDYAEAHNKLGVSLAVMGHEEEAFAEFITAVRLKPDLAEAHYNIGFAFGRNGYVHQAIAAWEQTLRLQPDHKEARRRLDEAYAALAREKQ